jgi:hypothetical protein
MVTRSKGQPRPAETYRGYIRNTTGKFEQARLNRRYRASPSGERDDAVPHLLPPLHHRLDLVVDAAVRDRLRYDRRRARA